MDDIVLTVNNSREINEMWQEFKVKSKEVGQKVNASETKVMQSSGMSKLVLRVGCIDLEESDSRVYLGQEVNMRHPNR